MSRSTVGSTNEFSVTWHAVVGQTWTVPFTDDLSLTNWTTVAQISAALQNVTYIAPGPATNRLYQYQEL